jgi:hypothetical protein
MKAGVPTVLFVLGFYFVSMPAIPKSDILTYSFLLKRIF